MFKYLILLLGACCLSAGATVINVPTDQATIQDGLDAAGEGDTVLVAPDTYTGPGNRRIVFGSANVTIMSSGGPEVTIIDCGGSSGDPQFGFLIGPGHDTTCRIEGFTITNAWHSAWDTVAISIMQSGAAVRDCRVVANQTAGLRLIGDWPEAPTVLLDNCEFSGSTGSDGASSYSSILYVTDCSFRNNNNNGLQLAMNEALYISGCEFSGNVGDGLWIEQNGGVIEIDGCTFYGNDNGFHWDWTPPKDGAEPLPAGPDEAMFLSSSIAAYNQHTGYNIVTAMTVDVTCNNSFGNGDSDYYGGSWGAGDEFGNISADPLFCNAASGDFTLREDSPCLSANNACGVLMGAFGEGCTAPPPTIVRRVPSEYPTIQAAVDDCDPGDTVLVAPGTYVGDGNRRIDPDTLNLVIMSESGPGATIIDCQGSEGDPQIAFDIHGGQDTALVIEGFTITNAYSDSWDSAAVRINDASLVIRNCDLVYNAGLAIYMLGQWPNWDVLIIDNCRLNYNGGDVAAFCNYADVRIFDSEIGRNARDGFHGWQMTRFEVEGSVFHHNPGTGLQFSQWDANCRLSNNTFAFNGTGIYLDWDYPKEDQALALTAFDSSGMSNSVIAFNELYGVNMMSPFSYYMICNDVYGNGQEDWHGTIDFYPGDPSGNFALDPLFCDSLSDDYHIGDGSPCAPANSSCGVLVGALDVGCAIAHQPTILRVPLEYPTIQAAINVSFDLDTVLVAPGNYTGDGNRDLNFLGKNLVLLSEQGPASTTINCEATSTDRHIGISITSGEDTAATIDGFTIRGAWSANGDEGAITVNGSGASIRNCWIEGTIGHGVRGNDATVVMESCVIDTSDWNGVHLTASEAIIDRLVASRNGHGIMWDGSGQHLEVSNSLLERNHGYGASLHYGAGTWSFTNCTFARNISGLVFNNRTSEKVAADTSMIINCLSAFNRQAGFASDGIAEPHLAVCSDAYGNAEGDWAVVGAIYGPGDIYGNISADPLLCDTVGNNYRVSQGSPCAPAYSACGELIGSEPAGCDCCDVRGDIDGSGAGPDISDLVHLVAYMFTQGPPPNCADEADMDGNYDLDIADLVYMVNYMFHGGPPPAPCP